MVLKSIFMKYKTSSQDKINLVMRIARKREFFKKILREYFEKSLTIN